MLICERPWFSQRVAMVARKDGEYTRPIVGSMVDIRIEDMIPNDVLVANFAMNLIGKLPNIAEINQVGRYFVSSFNIIDDVNLTETDVEKLLSTGEYFLLPHSPHSPHWQYTQAPWWEFAIVLDEYGGMIKAPKEVRSGEPTPEEIDERLDEYPENRGELQVLSPTTLDRWNVEGLTESYLKKLDRI